MSRQKQLRIVQDVCMKLNVGKPKYEVIKLVDNINLY